MATITSLGVGSGIDINTMVTQLVAVERQPILQLQSAATRLNTQISSLGKMQSLLSAVQDAANALTSNTLWTATTASSADESVVLPVGGSTATPGNYAVTVQSLAAPQTLVSSTVFGAATDLVGGGTLTLEIGSWDAGLTAFTPKSGGTPVAITVTAADTLQTLRDKINGQGAGVTATIVTDASGSRLSLRSSTSGVENGFRLTATDDDGNHTDGAGLSRLAFDPPGGATSMLHAQAGSNAAATINGVPVTTTTNDLANVVEGMTLRLRKNTATPVDVSVASDTEAVRKAVQTFADAYNALARYIGEQTKYDATTKVGGPLQGDSTVTSLLGRLRGVLNNPSGASASFARMSDIGLQLQRDGTLSVNSARLESALANPTELRKALANSDPLVASNNGFARQYAALATQALATDGLLTTRTEGLRKLVTKNSEQQERMEERVGRYRERLVAQFTAMDTNLARLNALQSYVTQQLAVLQNSSSSS